MTGYPEWNYPAFDDAADRIKAAAHGTRKVVTNPADNHNRQTDLPRWTYISKTLEQLRGLANLADSSNDECFVTVLEGWADSRGARLEVEVAHQLDLPVYELECILDPHWGDGWCQIKEGQTIPSCAQTIPSCAPHPCKCGCGMCKEGCACTGVPDNVKCPCSADSDDTIKPEEPVICELPHLTKEDEDECEAKRAPCKDGGPGTPLRYCETHGEWHLKPGSDEARTVQENVTEAIDYIAENYGQSVRASVLDEAKRLVTGDRNAQYGPPTQDFSRTADLLNTLGYRLVSAVGENAQESQALQPSDIAIIMIQLKVSRAMHSRGKQDHYVDIAGYAACGAECAEEADE